MLTINIGGKERPIKMKMRAVNIYRELTGVNLAGRRTSSFGDIVGDNGLDENGKKVREEKDFNPDLFVSFVYAILVNGCHPEKPDFTRDDVADWISLYDVKLVGQITNLYFQEMTGRTTDEILKTVQEIKNQQAPKDGAGVGQTSSDLLTGV